VLKSSNVAFLRVTAFLALSVTLPVEAFASDEEVSTEATLETAENMAADANATAESEQPERSFLAGGGRLLLTGGVSTIEGAAGGGLVPWALIGGYGTRDEIGLQAFATGVDSEDFTLASYGGAINVYDRVELSIARQNFNLRKVGAALGLGNRYTISQTIVGAKVRLFGNAVLDQDTILPQVSIGAQYKINDDALVVGSVLGLKRKNVDFYVAATKVVLSESLLLNTTVRFTRANQYGILGFGGLSGQDQGYKPQLEGSAALLLSRKFAVGGEFRTKSNRLEGALGGTTFREENAWDVFAAYAPARNVALTVAYARLGQIALRRQNAAYVSLQLGF
jgi:Protein of unknown function (DUF3034)